MKSIDFTKELDKLTEKREPFVVATVVGIEGSSIGKPGFKAIVSKEGHIVYGTVGGVCPESAISSFAQTALKTGRARTVKVYLEDAQKAVAGTVASTSEDEVHVETNCGGVMQIYIEPYLPADKLVIIGQGGKDDVEDGLVKLGKLLDFEVVVIDHLPVLEEEPDTLITDLDYDLTRHPFSDSDSVVMLTKGERDLPVLTALSSKKLRYVGLMASTKRIVEEFGTLIKNGVSRDFLDSVHTPIGADIGAITPQEIAIAIMADVIATKRGKPIPRKPVALEAPPSGVAQARSRS